MIIFAAFVLIVGLAGFIVLSAVRSSYKGDDRYDKATRRGFNIARWIVAAVAIVVLLGATIIGGIRVIDQTEVGIVKTFGRVDHVITSGLNFVNPFTDTVEKMDLKVHVREAAFASYTKDAQPLTAAIEYQYEPHSEQAIQIISQYGSYEIMETKLCAAVEERSKIVMARYSAMTLLENRSTLSAEVQTEVKELEELFPVNFTQVVVKDIDFSDAFEKAVEAKMEAEQNALRAENEKKEAITRAEQEREVARVQAEATVLAAQAEADALSITREALEKMPEAWITQQYLEKWDGKLPTFISGGESGSNVMIVPDLND